MFPMAASAPLPPTATGEIVANTPTSTPPPGLSKSGVPATAAPPGLLTLSEVEEQLRSKNSATMTVAELEEIQKSDTRVQDILSEVKKHLKSGSTPSDPTVHSADKTYLTVEELESSLDSLLTPKPSTVVNDPKKDSSVLDAVLAPVSAPVEDNLQDMSVDIAETPRAESTPIKSKIDSNPTSEKKLSKRQKKKLEKEALVQESMAARSDSHIVGTSLSFNSSADTPLRMANDSSMAADISNSEKDKYTVVVKEEVKQSDLSIKTQDLATTKQVSTSTKDDSNSVDISISKTDVTAATTKGDTSVSVHDSSQKPSTNDVSDSAKSTSNTKDAIAKMVSVSGSADKSSSSFVTKTENTIAKSVSGSEHSDAKTEAKFSKDVPHSVPYSGLKTDSPTTAGITSLRLIEEKHLKASPPSGLLKLDLATVLNTELVRWNEDHKDLIDASISEVVGFCRASVFWSSEYDWFSYEDFTSDRQSCEDKCVDWMIKILKSDFDGNSNTYSQKKADMMYECISKLVLRIMLTISEDPDLVIAFHQEDLQRFDALVMQFLAFCLTGLADARKGFIVLKAVTTLFDPDAGSFWYTSMLAEHFKQQWRFIFVLVSSMLKFNPRARNPELQFTKNLVFLGKAGPDFGHANVLQLMSCIFVHSSPKSYIPGHYWNTVKKRDIKEFVKTITSALNTTTTMTTKPDLALLKCSAFNGKIQTLLDQLVLNISTLYEDILTPQHLSRVDKGLVNMCAKITDICQVFHDHTYSLLTKGKLAIYLRNLFCLYALEFSQVSPVAKRIKTVTEDVSLLFRQSANMLVDILRQIIKEDSSRVRPSFSKLLGRLCHDLLWKQVDDFDKMLLLQTTAAVADDSSGDQQKALVVKAFHFFGALRAAVRLWYFYISVFGADNDFYDNVAVVCGQFGEFVSKWHNYRRTAKAQGDSDLRDGGILYLSHHLSDAIDMLQNDKNREWSPLDFGEYSPLMARLKHVSKEVYNDYINEREMLTPKLPARPLLDLPVKKSLTRTNGDDKSGSGVIYRPTTQLSATNVPDEISAMFADVSDRFPVEVPDKFLPKVLGKMPEKYVPEKVVEVSAGSCICSDDDQFEECDESDDEDDIMAFFSEHDEDDLYGTNVPTRFPSLGFSLDGYELSPKIVEELNSVRPMSVEDQLGWTTNEDFKKLSKVCDAMRLRDLESSKDTSVDGFDRFLDTVNVKVKGALGSLLHSVAYS